MNSEIAVPAFTFVFHLFFVSLSPTELSTDQFVQTHSQHAVMVTLLWPGKEFRISHQEMIKGMRIGGMGTALSYLDELVIPIIENTPQEEDLANSMEQVRLSLSGYTNLSKQGELTFVLLIERP